MSPRLKVHRFGHGVKVGILVERDDLETLARYLQRRVQDLDILGAVELRAAVQRLLAAVEAAR